MRCHQQLLDLIIETCTIRYGIILSVKGPSKQTCRRLQPPLFQCPVCQWVFSSECEFLRVPIVFTLWASNTRCIFQCVGEILHFGVYNHHQCECVCICVFPQCIWCQRSGGRGDAPGGWQQQMLCGWLCVCVDDCVCVDVCGWLFVCGSVCLCLCLCLLFFVFLVLFFYILGFFSFLFFFSSFFFFFFFWGGGVYFSLAKEPGLECRSLYLVKGIVL